MRQIPLTLFFIGFIQYAHADFDFRYPVSAANPPLIIEQDPDVPANPNIYAPPQTIPAQPKGSFVTPNVPVMQNPPPIIAPQQQLPPPQYQRQNMKMNSRSLFKNAVAAQLVQEDSPIVTQAPCPSSNDEKPTIITPPTPEDQDKIPLETKDAGKIPTQAS